MQVVQKHLKVQVPPATNDSQINVVPGMLFARLFYVDRVPSVSMGRGGREQMMDLTE